MAFELQDFHDLVEILEKHPEWRAELRRLVLTDELVTLPETTRDLVAAQQRTEQHLQQLTEAQKRTEQRLEQLAEAQRKTQQQLSQLAEDLEGLKTIVQGLVQSLQRVSVDVAKMKEYYLEQRYYTRAPAYFGKLIKRVRALPYEELSSTLDDAWEANILSREERDDLMNTDVVVRGRRYEDGQEVYLIVEVSWGIGFNDITRAMDGAKTFAKLGWTTIPVVAGEWIDPQFTQLANQHGVTVMLDGVVMSPAE